MLVADDMSRFNRLALGSEGMIANRTADQLFRSLGFSPEAADKMGDALGARIDAQNGDWAGYARNMLDLNSGLSSGDLDRLQGAGLPPAHAAPHPSKVMARALKLWGDKYHGFGTDAPLQRKSLAGMGGAPMEAMLQADPATRQYMERLLGGRIVPDGRMDGKVTVMRYRPQSGLHPLSGSIAKNATLSGVYSNLARFERNQKQMLGQLLNQKANTAGHTNMQAMRDPEAAGLADDMGMAPPLSFEDILFLLMLKYAKKKEKEIMGAAKQLMRKKDDGKGGAAGAAGTAGAGGAAGTGGAASAAGGKSGAYDPMDPKQSDTTKQAMLQKMMNDLQKVYTLLSNIMKSMHDMQMTAVRNIR